MDLTLCLHIHRDIIGQTIAINGNWSVWCLNIPANQSYTGLIYHDINAYLALFIVMNFYQWYALLFLFRCQEKVYIYISARSLQCCCWNADIGVVEVASATLAYISGVTEIKSWSLLSSQLKILTLGFSVTGLLYCFK